MGNGSLRTDNKRKISPEAVLTKIRDDGDFDRLRLKIIRQLKDDGELRDNIISMVRQSTALNRPGAETMKPRQLSDAIHQEIGDKVMGQISDGLWKIIKSPDGMKQEITETVQLVYNKLANLSDRGESSSAINSVTVQGHDNVTNGCLQTSYLDGASSDGEPNEPPGFSLHEHQRSSSIHREQHHEIHRITNSSASCSNRELTHGNSCSPATLEPVSTLSKTEHDLPESLECKILDDGSDNDPDLPPGFG